MERQEFDLNEYSLEVRDGKAVLKRDETCRFNPGDVLCNEWGDVVIYAETKDDGRIVAYVGYCPEYRNLTDSKSGGWGYAKDFVYATGEEEKMLFAEIGKRGYVWDAEKKELRKKRWRAKKGEEYWHAEFGQEETRAFSSVEMGREVDDFRYENENYFISQEVVVAEIEKVKKSKERRNRNERI